MFDLIQGKIGTPAGLACDMTEWGGYAPGGIPLGACDGCTDGGSLSCGEYGLGQLPVLLVLYDLMKASVVDRFSGS